MAAVVVDAERAREAEQLRIRGPAWSVLLHGFRHPIRFVRLLIARIGEDRTSTHAAAMAYFFFLAMFPMLLFVLALVSVLPVQGLEDWLLGTLARVVPGEAYGMLEETIRGILDQPRGGLLSLGAVLALWAASAGFLSVMDGLNQAYRVRESRPWWRLRVQALELTIALSSFMIVAFVLAVFGAPLAIWAGGYLGPAAVPVLLVGQWVIVIAVVTGLATVIYIACPDVDQDWHWEMPGAFVFTLGFGVTSGAFSFYVANFGAYDKTYGSLGAVIILLAWMYMLAFFLLLGGQVNALLEHLSPAGKAPGEKELPPLEVQAERVVQDEPVRA